MEWVTTSTILRDLRDTSNDRAWREFVSRFRAPVVRFAAAQGVPSSQTEDVAQETLAALAESLRTGRYDRARGRLSAWLFGIAWKQVLKERTRVRAREQPVGDGADVERAAAASADEKTAGQDWNTHWERFVAGECVAQMRREFPPDAVHAFELIVRDELSPREAAERMGVPVKFVYNSKHRIVKRMRTLREEFEEES